MYYVNCFNIDDFNVYNGFGECWEGIKGFKKKINFGCLLMLLGLVRFFVFFFICFDK